MVFPIGDTQVKGGASPIFTYAFLGVNIVIFLCEWQLQITNPDLFQNLLITYGSIPEEITRGQDLFTLLTSMFLHGGWMHLIGNMLFLWVFADNIEATIGSVPFVLFYLMGGVLAAGTHIIFNLGSEIPMVGASGAISAVLGAYLVMFPRSRIKVLVILFFRSFHVSALLFLGFWIVQQLISGFGSLNSALTGAGVAWWAHIGGFVFGVVAGFFFRPQVAQVTENYRR